MKEWILTLTSVAVASCVSLVGALTLTFQRERLEKTIIIFLPPIAVGALLGSVIFHMPLEEWGTNEAVWIIAGIAFLSIFQLGRLFRWHRHGEAKRKHIGTLILVSDGLHNFADGLIIAASYLVSEELGIATTLAIIFHEVPQEMADFGVLLYAGYQKSTALLLNFLTALTAAGGAVLVLMLGSLPEQVAQVIIPFTAGIFICTAVSLAAEIHKKNGGITWPEFLRVGIGVLVMYSLRFLE